MKDRKAKAPGRYSAIVPVEELEKLQTGNAFKITLARDDDPEIVGTPYSKAAVLPDNVAAAICPGVEDPTPAEAFAALQANKAPAGYGLGEKNGRYCEDLNMAVKPGFYYVGSQTIGLPNDYDKFIWGVVLVERRNDLARQTITYNGVSAARHVDATGENHTTEWEYINPPYEAGVAYRTIKRQNGKVVYEKLDADGILYFSTETDDSNTGRSWKKYAKAYGAATSAELTAHTTNKGNPHGVTCEQIGAAPAEHVDQELDDIRFSVSNVILLAEDNGALIETHIDNANNPHSITCEQIGAAPAGYGLGETAGRYVPKNTEGNRDLNLAVINGFYRMSDDCINFPEYIKIEAESARDSFFRYGTIFVESRGGVIHQKISYDDISAIRRSINNGTNWSSWQYVNPPFVLNKEYDTIKRYKGKIVTEKMDLSGVLWWCTEVTPWKKYAETYGAATSTDLASHTNNKSNPHGVTCEQIGAAKTSSVESHTTNKSNPHGVTCAQIGAAKAEGEHFAFEGYCERGYCRTINGVKECWVDVERSLSLAATEMNIALPFTPYSGGFSSVQITAGAEYASLKPVKDWRIATDDNILTLIFETGAMDELSTTMKLSIYLMSAPKAEG